MMQTIFQHALAFVIPVIFLVLATVAWALIIFQIPGNWVVLLLALLYGWYEGFEAVSWWVLVIGFIVAAIGEGAELAAGYMGAKKFGGRRMAGIVAIIGSIIGALTVEIIRINKGERLLQWGLEQALAAP